MPALASITINDGAVSPVAHTFSPVTTDGYLASLKERVGLPISYPALNVSVRPPVSGNGIYRVKETISVPTTAVVNGVTVVDFSQSVTIEFVLNERGSEQSRKDIRVLAANLLNHATTVTVVEKLEPIY